MDYFFTRIPTSVYQMPDGSKVEAEVVSASASADSPLHFNLFLWTKYMRDDDGDMLVGFDVEWCLYCEEGNNIESRVPLLKLGSRHGCLLLKLEFKSRFVHLQSSNPLNFELTVSRVKH